MSVIWPTPLGIPAVYLTGREATSNDTKRHQNVSFEVLVFSFELGKSISIGEGRWTIGVEYFWFSWFCRPGGN
jgi:hypothetical protein